MLFAVTGRAEACDPYVATGGGTCSGIWANPRCDDNANHLGGYYRTDHSWSYVKADIDVQAPFVFSHSGDDFLNNVSYAWVMLDVANVQNWAQFGPAIDNYGFRQDFAQCYSPSKGIDNIVRANPEPTGSTHTYKVVDRPDDTKWFYVDGSHVLSCGYTFNPDDAEMAGETDSARDQIPGKVSNHDNFASAQVTDTGGTAYDYLDGNSHWNVSDPWVKHIKSTDSSWGVWDGDCS